MSVQPSTLHLLAFVESLEPLVTPISLPTATQTLYRAATSIVEWSKTADLQSLDGHSARMFQHLTKVASKGLSGKPEDAKASLRALLTNIVVFKAALKSQMRKSKGKGKA